jgi:predicted aspartyl protease
MANHSYRLDKKLIVIPVIICGERGSLRSEFILTGSSGNIIDHSIALALGYSGRDAIGISSVSSAAGKEMGYRLVVKTLEVLGKKLVETEVRCHDLQEQGVEGLIGMSLLEQFDWCVHPKKQMISMR